MFWKGGKPAEEKPPTSSQSVTSDPDTKATRLDLQSNPRANFGPAGSSGSIGLGHMRVTAADPTAESTPASEVDQLDSALMDRALKWLSVLSDEDKEGKKPDLLLQVDMFKVLLDFRIKLRKTKATKDEEGPLGVEAMMALIRGEVAGALDKAIETRDVLVAPKQAKGAKLTPQEKERRARLDRARAIVAEVDPSNARTFSNADDSELSDLINRGRPLFQLEEASDE